MVLRLRPTQVGKYFEACHVVLGNGLVNSYEVPVGVSRPGCKLIITSQG